MTPPERRALDVFIKNPSVALKTARLHGNGFIQMDLVPGVRLHVWGDRVPAGQRVYTGIHDHRFGFTSRVLHGVMVNVDLIVGTGDDFELWTPESRPGTEDTKLQPTGEFCDFEIGTVLSVHAGQVYSFPPYLFHETYTRGLTVTLMTKTFSDPAYRVRVAVPCGTRPDNLFDRDQAVKTAGCQVLLEEVVTRIRDQYV